MGGELPRLVVFADDWGRHPSSAQHLVRELLPRWRVDWINTVGTRRPSLSVADAKKVAAKLASWVKPAESGAPESVALPANLTVHSPLHWPGFGAGWERSLNARLFDRALRPLIERAEAVVTTAPIVADLAARMPEANWIYYCVDDLSEWPGLDAEALRALEADFVPRAKKIIAVSEHLRARLKSMGRESELLTHGFDPSHWTSVAQRGPRARRDVATTMFWGVIDRRLETQAVLDLAESTHLVLVGPQQAPDPAIAAHPKIDFRGPVPYAALPLLAMEADVLVMPYADLPVTRAMQPLKLKEYLATGKPVVVRSLPSTREWADCCDVCDTPEAFVEAVKNRIETGVPAEQLRNRERLIHESWAGKAKLFERWLDGAADQTGS